MVPYYILHITLHSVLLCIIVVGRGMDLEAWIPIPLGPPLTIPVHLPRPVFPSSLASLACLAYGSHL